MANYIKDEVFDNRIYDNYPYLVLVAQVYRIKLGVDNLTLRANVYERDDLFGDPLPLNLAGLEIWFNIYNAEGVLINVGLGYVSDITLSEVAYDIGDLDIKDTGKYYGEFVLIDLDSKKTVIPNPTQKQRILINVT